MGFRGLGLRNPTVLQVFSGLVGLGFRSVGSGHQAQNLLLHPRSFDGTAFRIAYFRCRM